jgi:carboxylate-amine ligase
VLDEMDLREEVMYIHNIIAEGTSADRQLRCYQETGDFKAVVDQLISETIEGI